MRFIEGFVWDQEALGGAGADVSRTDHSGASDSPNSSAWTEPTLDFSAIMGDGSAENVNAAHAANARWTSPVLRLDDPTGRFGALIPTGTAVEVPVGGGAVEGGASQGGEPSFHAHSLFEASTPEAEDFVQFGGRWAGGTVTWSIVGVGATNQTGTAFFTGSSVSMSSLFSFNFQGVLAQAFASWSQVANLKFVHVADGGGDFGVGSTAQIRIGAGYIDGSSNVLARGFSPPDGGVAAANGDIVFDSGEPTFWTAQSFLAVAAHEIGHAIGLRHTNVMNSLMNPYYNSAISTPQADDIAGAQSLYGAPHSTKFSSPVLAINGFGSASGWASNMVYPRKLADVNGDGRDDIVAFGSPGVYVALSGGGGTFQAVSLATAAFAHAAGWANEGAYPRRLADVNGDGRDDIVAFGSAGVYVALSTGGVAFGAVSFVSASFGAAGGWADEASFPRTLGDVNGDGRADLVGFGSSGVYVALASGNGGFGAVFLATEAFGATGGWSNEDLHKRALGDVNGDGRDDIVAFGAAGVYVALAEAGGFGPAQLALKDFGTASGWTSDALFPRKLADVNGDGRDDIVAFDTAGVYVALATGLGDFGAVTQHSTGFGVSTGWVNSILLPRELGDLNGDNKADIAGFDHLGVYTSWSLF